MPSTLIAPPRPVPSYEKACSRAGNFPTIEVPGVLPKGEAYLAALTEAGFSRVERVDFVTKGVSGQHYDGSAVENLGVGAGYASVWKVSAIPPGGQEAREFALKFADPRHRARPESLAAGDLEGLALDPELLKILAELPLSDDLDDVNETHPGAPPQSDVADVFQPEVEALDWLRGVDRSLQAENIFINNGRVSGFLSPWFTDGMDLHLALNQGKISRADALKVLIEGTHLLYKHGLFDIDGALGSYMVRAVDGRMVDWLLVDVGLVIPLEAGNPLHQIHVLVHRYLDHVAVSPGSQNTPPTIESVVEAISSVAQERGIGDTQPFGIDGFAALLEKTDFSRFLRYTPLPTILFADLVAGIDDRLGCGGEPLTPHLVKIFVSAANERIRDTETVSQEVQGFLKDRKQIRHGPLALIDLGADPEAVTDDLIKRLQALPEFDRLAGLAGRDDLVAVVRDFLLRDGGSSKNVNQLCEVVAGHAPLMTRTFGVPVDVEKAF